MPALEPVTSEVWPASSLERAEAAGVGSMFTSVGLRVAGQRGARVAPAAAAGCRNRAPAPLRKGAGQAASASGKISGCIEIPSALVPTFFPDPSRSAMSHHDIRSAKRPDPDQPMVDIANYVADYKIQSAEAYDTARYMLLDSIGCS